MGEQIIEKIQKQIRKERIDLSSREFLLCLLDLPMKLLFVSHPYYTYRKMYEGYQKWRHRDRNRYYKMLYKLKKQELIIFDYEEGIKPKLPKLTEKGKQKAMRYAAYDLDILKPKTWDRKWRLIIFDIPDKKKKSREFVRKELKRLGFFKLQESVFIYPFKCKDEIEFIRLAAGLSKYELCYLRVDNFDLSPGVLNHFIRAGLINSKEMKNKQQSKAGNNK